MFCSISENLGQGIDLTEEEQIKILEDYEIEQKKKSPEGKKKKGKSSKQLVEKEQQEMVVVEQPASKEKQGMVVIEEPISVTDSTSSTESKDTDDWEKDFDLGDAEISDK